MAAIAFNVTLFGTSCMAKLLLFARKIFQAVIPIQSEPCPEDYGFGRNFLVREVTPLSK